MDGNNWKICACGLTIDFTGLFVDHEGYTSKAAEAVSSSGGRPEFF